MEGSLVEIFFRLVSEYGIATAVFIVVIIVFVFSSGQHVLNGLKFIFSRFFHLCDGDDEIILSEHTVFAELDYLMNHKIKFINTHCILRRNIYMDIMSENIRCTKEYLLDFIKKDIESLTPKELYIEVRDMFEEIFDSTDEKCVSNGVPDFILGSMREKIVVVWKFYLNQIKIYCYNEYLYNNNTERVCAILDMISTMIECYMNILEKNLAEFNGDIKSLNYKGYRCTKCSECVHDVYLRNLKREIEEEEEEKKKKSPKIKKTKKIRE